MTDNQFVGLTIMFVVLCVTLYKIANPPEPPKALFKPEPSRVDANPPRLGEDKMFKNYSREKTPASKEL